MLTGTDFFCGLGGSTEGAQRVKDVRITYAANHWPLAVKTHGTNHPHAEHDCADISQVTPSLYPRTDFAWFSPECTNHSIAKTHKAQTKNEADSEERSRATMWDVVRFTEYHKYDA